MLIAANVIIMRVDGFAMMPNFSFGTAMTTYAGQNVGARATTAFIKGAPGNAYCCGNFRRHYCFDFDFGKNLMSIFTETQALVGA